MKNNLLKRFLTGVILAVVLMSFVAAVQAQSALMPSGPAESCGECHESVVLAWQDSAHGRAVTDPVFQEAWEEGGSQAECLQCHATGYDQATGTLEENGISCGSCHMLGENSPHHPEMAMHTDPSSRLCGTCHVDTHTEWQASVHGEGELSCVRCHNPHTTSLKGATVQEVCSNCHPAEGHHYANSDHGSQGMLCTDCHLRVAGSPPGDGHGQRQHTFTVDLNTCNDCHGEQMHLPSNQVLTPTQTTNEGGPGTGQQSGGFISLTQSPQVIDITSMLLVGLGGMAIGFFIAPAADRWHGRITARK